MMASMAAGQNGSERRKESRYHYTNVNDCLSWGWRLEGQKGWKKVRVQDVSHSGVGVLLNKYECPRIGDVVELISDQTRMQIRAEVVRNEPWWDGDLISVGGRIL